MDEPLEPTDGPEVDRPDGDAAEAPPAVPDSAESPSELPLAASVAPEVDRPRGEFGQPTFGDRQRSN